jgi:hypothetical protein
VGAGFGFYPFFYYPYYYPYYYPSYYYPWCYYYPSYVDAYYPLDADYPLEDYVAPSVDYTPSYSYPPSYGRSLRTTTFPTPDPSVMPRATVPGETIPAPRPSPGKETYPYDGGPANPVPMPNAEPTPSRKARPTIVTDARLVAKAPRYSYQAYGARPASRTPSEDRQVAVKQAGNR